MWKEFNEDIERRMAPGEDLDILKAFANKFPELCARIAGVLTLIDNLEASEVGEKQLSSAIQLMKFYGHEIARIYCMGTVGDHLKQAQTLLDWIRSKELIEIYPVLVYQNGPSLFRTKGRALVALRTLENHGCLIPLEEGTEVDGKARKEAWQVVFPP
jgi:hypothetical protein